MKKIGILLSLFLSVSMFFVSCGNNNSSSINGNINSSEEGKNPIKSENSKDEHEHNYKEEVVEPTCSEEGYITYTCSCGDSYTENLGLIDHALTDWNLVKEEGKNLYYERGCENCSFTESKVESRPSCKEHSYQEISRQDATCTESGEVVLFCNVCEETYVQTLDPLDHDYQYDVIDEPTCIEKGLQIVTCSRCDYNQEETIKENGHKYVDGVCFCGQEDVSSFRFELNEDQASYTVYGNDNTYSKVKIPSKYNNLPVTKIGEFAFNNYSNLVEVEIPSSVETIGNYAFGNLYSLSKVILQEGLLNIGSDAFSNCFELKEIELPSTVEKIDSNAFFYCSKLEEIKVPSSCYLGKYVFEGCENLNKLELPWNFIYTDFEETGLFGSLFGKNNYLNSSNVTTIKQKIGNKTYTYYVPSSLNKITINGGSVNDRGFANASTIKEVIFKAEVKSLGNSAFSQSNIETITFDGCKDVVIGTYCFDQCKNLVDINYINDGYIGEINAYAFNTCTSLKKLNFPEGLKTIKENAFKNTSNFYNYLEELVLPSTVESIEKSCLPESLISLEIPFVGLTRNEPTPLEKLFTGGNSFDIHDNLLLKEVKITDAISLADYSFASLLTLETIELNEGIQTIGQRSFSSTALTTITFPNSVTSIGESVLTQVSNLKEIYLPNQLTSIPNNMCGSMTPNIEVCVIPETVTSIGNNAFSSSSKYQYNIPKNLEVIGNNAFDSCKHQSELILPDTVTSIGSYAFNGCQFEKIDVPETIEYIGSYAFSYYILDELVVEELTLPFIGETSTTEYSSGISDLFGMFSSRLKIKKLTITNDENVEDLNNIGGIEELYISDNTKTFRYYGINQLIEQNILRVLECPLLSDSSVIYFSNNTSLERIKISKEYNTLYFTNLENLKELEISSSSTYYRIYGCDNLESLTIPSLGESYLSERVSVNNDKLVINISESGVIRQDQLFDIKADINFLEDVNIELYELAFSGYLGNEINLSKNVSVLDAKAFSGTSALINWNDYSSESLPTDIFNGYLASEVNLPSTIKKIVKENFNGYSGTINFKDSNVVTLEENALTGYLGDKIVLPSSVKDIKGYAFKHYSGQIEFNNPTIERIVEYTFSGYLGKEIIIPNSVKYIEPYAFNGLYYNKLETLEIPFIGTSKEQSLPLYRFFDDLNSGVYIDTIKVTNAESIEKDTFDNVEVNNLSFNEGLLTIKKDALSNTLVKNLMIPNSVTSIEEGALSGVYYLESLEVPFIGISRDKNSDASLNSLGSIFSKYTYEDIKTYLPTLTSIKVNASKIYDGALENWVYLKNVVLSEKLNYIGENVFKNCYSLENVYYNGNYDSWAGNISFNGYLSNPMYYANNFYINDELVENFIINVNTIKDYSFVGFKNINVVLDSNVKVIGERVFSYSDVKVDMTNSSVEEIKDYAFEKYYGEELILPSSLITLGNYPFKDTKVNISFSDNSSLKTLNAYAFGGYQGYEINLPNGLETIKNNAFYNASGLYRISLPESLINLEDNAFAKTDIYEYVNDSSFEFVSKELIISDNYCFYINEDKYYLFDYLGEDKYLTLPDSILGNSYYVDSNMFNEVDIYSVIIPSTILNDEIRFTLCPKLVEVYNLSTAEIISNNGVSIKKIHTVMEDSSIISEGEFLFVLSSDDEYFLFDYVGDDFELTLPSSINDSPYSIKDFFMFQDTSVYSLMIPNGVISIGEYAFNHAGINYLSGLNGVKEIGQEALVLPNLKNPFIVLPSIEKLGQGALSELRGGSVYLGSNIQEINENCFLGIEEIIIQDSITKLPTSSLGKIYYCGLKSNFENITNASYHSTVIYQITLNNYQELDYDVTYFELNGYGTILLTRKEFENKYFN